MRFFYPDYRQMIGIRWHKTDRDQVALAQLGQTAAVPDETRLMVMGSQQEQTERIEALRGLIERLSAPELTLTEAKVLRGCITDLLERDNQPAGWGQMASSRGRGDGPRHKVWSPETSMREAG
jgi:hypothetical protein